MFTKIVTAVSALALAATGANALLCAEAGRFGEPRLTPSTGLQPGSTVTINTNFACSFYFGIVPTYTTYQANVGPSVDYEVPVFIAYREPVGISEDQPWDNFTVTIPDAYWEANTTYPVTLWTYYDNEGPNGGTYLTEGGTEALGITIASTTPA